MDKNSVLLYLRVTANTISLILTLTFYILVFKRQTDALNVVRVREVVHAYYLLSLLAQVLFMPQSILVNLIKEKLLVGDRPRRIWELVSLALYTEVEEIIPAFLVALVIVSALDTINNTAKLWKVVLWGMTAYVPITFLVHVGCLMSPDFCASTPMVEKIILYARELFVCIPYFLSLVFIVILFRKGREIQEMDRAVALMNEQGFEETIQNTALRRWQVTTLFILRSLSMTISLVWNVTWVTLYFQTTPPFPIQLTEVALYLAYNALNASVFFMKRRRRPLAAPLVAFSVESTEVNDQ
ncbi:hypothetical protein GMRT_15000 [Giardia muris]|uniref:Uncharacterized protein n=1 Tax=Giardia muris TaxID=5742 RepID=A0A4Z1T308_GIAMU|nr:hypothetical protein GMRT_15000 [Giardia muris]|eukprot:TNJ27437.1 hypothetical protein GMRT_15000 [Giardia muris]